MRHMIHYLLCLRKGKVIKTYQQIVDNPPPHPQLLVAHRMMAHKKPPCRPTVSAASSRRILAQIHQDLQSIKTTLTVSEGILPPHSNSFLTHYRLFSRGLSPQIGEKDFGHLTSDFETATPSPSTSTLKSEVRSLKSKMYPRRSHASFIFCLYLIIYLRLLSSEPAPRHGGRRPYFPFQP